MHVWRYREGGGGRFTLFHDTLNLNRVRANGGRDYPEIYEWWPYRICRVRRTQLQYYLNV